MAKALDTHFDAERNEEKQKKKRKMPVIGGLIQKATNLIVNTKKGSNEESKEVEEVENDDLETLTMVIRECVDKYKSNLHIENGQNAVEFDL